MERQLLRHAAIALVVATLLASACGGEKDPAAGSALESSVGSTYSVTGVAALPPGEEVSIMLTRLRNTTGSQLVVRSVEPLDVAITGDGDTPATVAGVDLAVRDRELAETVPLGFYPGPRPALLVDGACAEQPTVAAAGFRLEPPGGADDEVYLVVRVRTRAPGTFALGGQRVVYELDGVLYRQDFRDGLELEVREGAAPEIPAEQAACAAR